MNKNKLSLLLILILTSLSVSACSSVSNVFGGDDDDERLEGERLSVLELQKNLATDTVINKDQEFILPDAWVNGAWPQSGGYPNHSMQNLSFENASFKKIWSADIGSGSSKALPLNARPVVANGMVYTLDTSSRVSAFNAENGKRIWETEVEKEDENEGVVAGGVSFAHNMVYVTNGYDEVLALAHDTGDIIWRKRLPAPSRAAPTVIGGRVFISTVDSRLIALNAQDGSGLWDYIGINESAGLLGAASPAANNDIVVPVFSSGEITALRIENGSVAWSDNLSSVHRYGGGLESISDIKALPILDRGLVIAISFAGKIVAIDERTGTRIWQREISGDQTPWIAGNHLYLVSSDNQLIAMNVVDGSIFWITELQSFENEKKKTDPIHWTGPILASGKLIITGSHGYIFEVNAQNGEILREVRTKQTVEIPPVIAQGTLYLLTESGSLIAYR